MKNHNIQIKHFINKLVQIYSSDKIYTGQLLAVDKFMNVVLAQTIESDLNHQNNNSRDLGLIFLRGEQIQFMLPSDLDVIQIQKKMPQEVINRQQQKQDENKVQKVPGKPKIPGIGRIPGLKGIK